VSDGGIQPEVVNSSVAFSPAWFFRSGHLQSMLSSMVPRRWLVRRRARALLAASEDVLLDCGDGVRLLGHYARSPQSNGRLVVLLHGWEGNAESVYVLSCASHLYAQGCDIFRLNFRDHGPTHHLNPDIFHSCRLPEVVRAIQSIARRWRHQSMSLVGYSLGGNFALRVATVAPAHGLALARVIALCPVLDPARTMHRLNQSFVVYRYYFIRKWRRSLLIKQRAWPALYKKQDLLKRRGLTEMIEHLVVRYTTYDSSIAYLNDYALVGSRLADLPVKSHIYMSMDDPIVDIADVARLAETPNLAVTTTRHGGHCGFLDGIRRESWADRQVARLLCIDSVTHATAG